MHIKYILQIYTRKGPRKLNILQKTILLASSLSIYKNVLNNPAQKAFINLINSTSLPKEDFFKAWGEFFSVLSENEYTQNFYACMKNSVIYDENCFSRAIAGGTENTLAQPIISAAKRDMKIILDIGKITPNDVINNLLYKEDLKEMLIELPMWEVGEGAYINLEQEQEEIIKFYRKNGCGMYAKYNTFVWRCAEIQPVKSPDRISIQELKGYKYPRGLVVENTKAFINNKSANNCLLYGDKGTGKSSTVKAIVNEYSNEKLRIVEISKEQIKDFPILLEKISQVPMKFIIFIDDLSFQQQDSSYTALKALLEGGLAARPKNALIYATSNRRHLIKENFSDRAGNELHRNDSIQESLSLADRFGLAVNFSLPNKNKYLEIVKSIAESRNIDIDEERLFFEAEQWALEHGGRSPRRARQFIDSLSAKM